MKIGMDRGTMENPVIRKGSKVSEGDARCWE